MTGENVRYGARGHSAEDVQLAIEWLTLFQRGESKPLPHDRWIPVALEALRELAMQPLRDGYRIALRPDEDGDDPFNSATLMDDIVVKGVSMFRAEAMGDGEWFACCYLEGSDDRIAWWISAKCRPRRIEWVTTEFPDVPYEESRAERSARIAPTDVSGRSGAGS